MEVFELEEDAAARGFFGVSMVGKRVVEWDFVCTILQLWRGPRTRSTGSKPRAWGGLEVVDYPCLKMLGLGSELSPISKEIKYQWAAQGCCVCDIGCRKEEATTRALPFGT